MNSKDFDGSNATFHAKGFNEKNLRAHVSDNIRITSWQLSDEDIKTILQNREVFLIEVYPMRVPKHAGIKLITDNPVPLLHQLQNPIIPILNGKDKTNG